MPDRAAARGRTAARRDVVVTGTAAASVARSPWRRRPPRAIVGEVRGRRGAGGLGEPGEAALRCPFCGAEDTQVKDSRPAEEGGAIRRRRQCPGCGARFTTFERVQLRELTVVKRDGRRVAFDREKLARSIRIAARKRGIEEEQVERLVNGIVRRIETGGEGDVPSRRIGELAMEGLAALDEVAYVRFASVYKDFSTARDFDEFIRRLPEDEAG